MKPRQYGATLGSNLVLSAYWFAASFKWFILLQGLLASRVKEIVPMGEESAAWGMVLSFGAIEAMVGPIVMGVWSDRVGRRLPFLFVGALLTCGALGILANASTLAAMVFGYFLLQVSDDVATAPYSALIPDLVKPEHRGYASGVMGLLQQIAQIFAAVVLIMFSKDAKTSLAIIAAVNVIGALIVVAFIRERVGKGKVDTELASTEGEAAKPKERLPVLSLESWLAPWKIKDFRWVWFTRFLNSCGMYAVTTYLSYYFADKVKVFNLFGLQIKDSVQAQAALILWVSLIAAFSSVFGGRLADKIGRKAIIVWAGVAMFCVLIPFALIPNFSVIFVLATLFGGGYGAYIGADWALAADIMPNEADYARDMGMWTMSVPMAQVVVGQMGQVIGPLNQATNGAGYQIIFLLAACLFLSSTVLIRMVRGAR